MEYKNLGKTGLNVSRLGIGLAEVGSNTDPTRVKNLLDVALEAGINFLDTAACYGDSEELVGRALFERRDQVILATKAGHVTGDYEGEEWTAPTIHDSIDRSLKRLGTDYIDVVQLHSCGVDILERGDVIRALKDAQQAGKVRFIGYSGDGEAAKWAVDSGQFDTLQTTFNLLDQDAYEGWIKAADQKDMGIIIKRPIANAAVVAALSPYSDEQESVEAPDRYTVRAQRMFGDGSITGAPENSIALALAFTLAHPEVDTAIVGTRSPEHMHENVEIVENQEPLPEDIVEELRRRYERMQEAEA